MEIYVAAYLFMSLITFCFYWADKVKAEKRRWRIKEVKLLGLTFMLGSLRAFLGLYLIRHKNRHWYFVITTFLSLALHIYLGFLIYQRFGFVFK